MTWPVEGQDTPSNSDSRAQLLGNDLGDDSEDGYYEAPTTQNVPTKVDDGDGGQIFSRPSSSGLSDGRLAPEDEEFLQRTSVGTSQDSELPAVRTLERPKSSGKDGTFIFGPAANPNAGPSQGIPQTDSRKSVLVTPQSEISSVTLDKDSSVEVLALEGGAAADAHDSPTVMNGQVSRGLAEAAGPVSRIASSEPYQGVTLPQGQTDIEHRGGGHSAAYPHNPQDSPLRYLQSMSSRENPPIITGPATVPIPKKKKSKKVKKTRRPRDAPCRPTESRLLVASPPGIQSVLQSQDQLLQEDIITFVHNPGRKAETETSGLQGSREAPTHPQPMAAGRENNDSISDNLGANRIRTHSVEAPVPSKDVRVDSNHDSSIAAEGHFMDTEDTWYTTLSKRPHLNQDHEEQSSFVLDPTDSHETAIDQHDHATGQLNSNNERAPGGQETSPSTLVFGAVSQTTGPSPVSDQPDHPDHQQPFQRPLGRTGSNEHEALHSVLTQAVNPKVTKPSFRLNPELSKARKVRNKPRSAVGSASVEDVMKVLQLKLTERHDYTQAQLDATTSEVRILETTCAELHEKLEAGCENETRLRDKVQELTLKLSTVKDRGTRLGKFHAGMANDLDGLRRENKGLRRGIENLLGEYQTVRGEVTSLYQQMSAASEKTSKVTRSNLDLTQDLYLEKEAATQSSAYLEKQLGEKVGLLSEERDRRVSLEEQLKTQREELTSISRAIQTSTEKVIDQILISQGQIEEHEGGTELLELLESCRQELLTVKEGQPSVLEAVGAMRGVFDSFVTRAGVRINELGSGQSKVNGAIASLDGRVMGELKALAEKLTSSEALAVENARLKEHAGTLEERCKALDTSCKELDAQVTASRSVESSLKKTIAQLETIRPALHVAGSAQDATAERTTSLETENANLRGEAKKLQAEVTSVTKELNASKAVSEGILKELGDAQKGLSDAQRDLLVANNERETTMKESERKLEQMQNHIRKQNAKLSQEQDARHQNEVRRLNNRVAQLEESIELNTRATGEMEQLKANVQLLKEQSDAKDELASKDAIVQQAKLEKEAALKRVKQLESGVKREELLRIEQSRELKDRSGEGTRPESGGRTEDERMHANQTFDTGLAHPESCPSVVLQQNQPQSAERNNHNVETGKPDWSSIQDPRDGREAATESFSEQYVEAPFGEAPSPSGNVTESVQHRTPSVVYAPVEPKRPRKKVDRNTNTILEGPPPTVLQQLRGPDRNEVTSQHHMRFSEKAIPESKNTHFLSDPFADSEIRQEYRRHDSDTSMLMAAELGSLGPLKDSLLPASQAPHEVAETQSQDELLPFSKFSTMYEPQQVGLHQSTDLNLEHTSSSPTRLLDEVPVILAAQSENEHDRDIGVMRDSSILSPGDDTQEAIAALEDDLSQIQSRPTTSDLRKTFPQPNSASRMVPSSRPGNFEASSVEHIKWRNTTRSTHGVGQPRASPMHTFSQTIQPPKDGSSPDYMHRSAISQKIHKYGHAQPRSISAISDGSELTVLTSASGEEGPSHWKSSITLTEKVHSQHDTHKRQPSAQASKGPIANKMKRSFDESTPRTPLGQQPKRRTLRSHSQRTAPQDEDHTGLSQITSQQRLQATKPLTTDRTRMRSSSTSMNKRSKASSKRKNTKASQYDDRFAQELGA